MKKSRYISSLIRCSVRSPSAKAKGDSEGELTVQHTELRRKSQREAGEERLEKGGTQRIGADFRPREHLPGCTNRFGWYIYSGNNWMSLMPSR
jgi:hypothetical protein